MKKNESRIPNTYTKKVGGKEYVYVRVQIDGRKAEAPLSNEWLTERGGRASKDMRRLARMIEGQLRETLRKKNRAHQSRRSVWVKDAVDAFLQSQEELSALRRPSKGQRDRRRSVLLLGNKQRRPFVSFVGNPRLDALHSGDLERFESHLDQSGYRPESIRSYMADLLRFFSWCEETGLLRQSPASRGRYKLRRGGELEERDAAYTKHEMKKFWKALEEYPVLRRMFLVISQTGMRRKEYLDLKVEMIDFSSDCIRVVGARKNRERQPRIRLVPMPKQLVFHLKNSISPSSAYLATGESRRMTENALRCALRRFRTKTGLDLSPQRLRRTYGQRRLEANEPIHLIAEAMGSSPRILNRWYVRPTRRQLSSAAENALGISHGKPHKVNFG